MSCPRFDRPQRQRGAALVVAMLVFALCTALIVGLEKEFALFYQRGANSFLAEQGDAYLRGAEELAAVVLAADYEEDQQQEQARDDLQEIWAQQSASYSLDEGGFLTGSLADLQGRFNLNRLAEPAPQREGLDGPRFTPAQQQFIRLLQSLEGVPVSREQAIQITQSVSDWLDKDNNTRPDGAEDDFYYGREPAHRAANRPMVSATELRAVAYMTPEIYSALYPLVSAWPQDPKPMNIHTAAPALLRSINLDGELAPLSEGDGERLVEYRSEAGFADLEDFFVQAALDEQAVGEVRPLLGETTSWFLLGATVEVAERQMRLYSVLQRRGRSIQAVVRASGSL